MSTLSSIPVNLPGQSYSIIISESGLDDLGVNLLTYPERPLGKKILIVSNPIIFKHYGQRVIATVTKAGFQVGYCLLPSGERYKTLKSVQRVYNAALEHRLERSSTILALGGGVIGDMAGFAAATWLRGIHLVQVPTSLLAMVDAAIGGKTGVNHPLGKNLIGAFHQPRLVLIDPTVLKTLPVREFRAAMAEVIKYGVIWDQELFNRLEDQQSHQRLDQFRYVTTEFLHYILNRSCSAKAHIVSQDEKEKGLRAILNYGHTIGHGVESLTGYGLINHGEGVAIGMIAAGQIAVALGQWQQSESDRQLTLIQAAGLPTRLPKQIDINSILESLQLDKKVESGQIRFVLPTTIGSATITNQVPSSLIRGVLTNMQD